VGSQGAGGRLEAPEGMEAVSCIHPDVRRALEQIDAAVFSGDTFHDDGARAEFFEYLVAWRMEIDDLEEQEPLEQDEDEGEDE